MPQGARARSRRTAAPPLTRPSRLQRKRAAASSAALDAECERYLFTYAAAAERVDEELEAEDLKRRAQRARAAVERAEVERVLCAMAAQEERDERSATRRCGARM